MSTTARARRDPVWHQQWKERAPPEGFRVVNRIRHARLRRAVHAYVDGELPAGLRQAVRRHLEDCPACGGDAWTWWVVKRSLRRLRAAPSPGPGTRLRTFARRPAWDEGAQDR